MITTNTEWEDGRRFLIYIKSQLVLLGLISERTVKGETIEENHAITKYIWRIIKGYIKVIKTWL